MNLSLDTLRESGSVVSANHAGQVVDQLRLLAANLAAKLRGAFWSFEQVGNHGRISFIGLSLLMGEVMRLAKRRSSRWRVSLRMNLDD
jgi:hypothetical protein